MLKTGGKPSSAVTTLSTLRWQRGWESNAEGPGLRKLKRGGGTKGGARETRGTEVQHEKAGGIGTPDKAATAVCPVVGVESVGSMRVACKHDPIESRGNARRLSNKCTPSLSMGIALPRLGLV